MPPQTSQPEGPSEMEALRARVAEFEERLVRAEGDARRLAALAQTGQKASAAAHRIRNRAATLLAAAELLAARTAGQGQLEKLAQAIVEEAESIAKAVADIAPPTRGS